jgi:hypothetical protein
MSAMIAAAHKKVESFVHIEFYSPGTLIAFGFSGAGQGPF